LGGPASLGTTSPVATIGIFKGTAGGSGAGLVSRHFRRRRRRPAAWAEGGGFDPPRDVAAAAQKGKGRLQIEGRFCAADRKLSMELRLRNNAMQQLKRIRRWRLKKNNIDIFYFACLIPMYALFTEEGDMDKRVFCPPGKTSRRE
uniref:Neur_chan_memb domain-containing protein n=1 Tax=Macrostomum lignano TaxID=282301 RepID=A0A1I8FBU3_9PLAT